MKYLEKHHIEESRPGWSTDATTVEVQAIRIGLPALDPLGRRAVELAFFGGLTVPAIAGFVAQPEARVRTAMRAALLELVSLVPPSPADPHRAA